MHIRHAMLWKFKNKKDATETAKEICSMYDQCVSTDCQVRNWVSMFRFGDASLKDEPRPGCSSDLYQNALRIFGMRSA